MRKDLMNKWAKGIVSFLFLMMFIVAGVVLAWLRYSSFQDSIFNGHVWNQDIFNEMVWGVGWAGFFSGILFTLGCPTLARVSKALKDFMKKVEP
jgi:hypothetical protein